LPVYFAEANVFVLPSLHDGWGVVVNQAVSAGMAIIASDTVGAAVDLVSENANGLIFPNQNEEALTTAMRFFAEHSESICRFGQASRALGPDLCPEQGADRWYRFCQAILHRRGIYFPDQRK
jgi:glycosyltransferase involved in cell wall biosynthesis